MTISVRFCLVWGGFFWCCNEWFILNLGSYLGGEKEICSYWEKKKEKAEAEIETAEEGRAIGMGARFWNLF